MVMPVLRVVSAADTAEQGAAFLSAVIAELAQNEVVTLSFSGVTSMTSSFANAGLVPLLERFSLGEIKRRLRIVHSTRQINDMVRSRLEREAERYCFAA